MVYSQYHFPAAFPTVARAAQIVPAPDDVITKLPPESVSPVPLSDGFQVANVVPPCGENETRALVFRAASCCQIP